MGLDEGCELRSTGGWRAKPVLRRKTRRAINRSLGLRTSPVEFGAATLCSAISFLQGRSVPTSGWRAKPCLGSKTPGVVNRSLNCESLLTPLALRSLGALFLCGGGGELSLGEQQVPHFADRSASDGRSK